MSTLFFGTGFLALTQRQQVQWRTIVMLCGKGFGGGPLHHSHSNSNNSAAAFDAKSMAWTAGGLGMAALTASWLRQTWNTWWMSSKIVDSTSAVELWNRNWHAAIQAENMLKRQRSRSGSSFTSFSYSALSDRKTDIDAQADEKDKTAFMGTSSLKSSYGLNSSGSEVSQQVKTHAFYTS
jgi:hypothetical protein